MNNKIYIVGTPIGNLEDITYRAIKVLQSSDIILCEDIRVSQKLLQHYEINNKRLIAYHKFNEKEMTPKIIELLQQGMIISLISDAGMPCVSDPGFEVIKAAKAANIGIDVIGGPTALIHAIIKANLDNCFTFLGFLKDKSGARQNQLKSLTFGTYVAYVSPHKLLSTIKDFEIIFQEQVKLFLIKEMTKMFETSFEGTPQEVLMQLSKEDQRGEYTLVFSFKEPKKLKINKYKKEIK